MHHPPDHKGTLYVVATPLGNLEDITLRAVRLLRECEAIACEDTRRTSILLRHLGIEGKKLVSYHTANEARAIGRILQLLQEGRDVALVTDAGTPAVSDPGFALVRAAAREELRVLPIPGPSALTAALSVSPVPSDGFIFAGFLPQKKGRKGRLGELCASGRPFVLYESPYRIGKLLDEIAEALPDSRLFIAREMTKLHEEYLTGTPQELRPLLEEGRQRGEFVVLVNPAGESRNKNSKEQHADHY